MDTWYIFTLIFVAAAGASVGSFSNVCIYRVPLHLSIVHPGSYCPNCKTPLAPWDNIPVLSYLFLRGKCRYCGSGISLRYPVVELLTALFYLLLYIKFDLPVAITYAILVSALLVITFIDIDHMIIPNVITFPGIPIGLVLTYFFLPHSIMDSVIGMLGGSGFFLLTFFTYLIIMGKEGLGMGDVKMIAMIGAFLGWEKVFLTIFLASLLGSIIGIIIERSFKARIPFGPFLASGAVLSIFFGDKLIEYYFNFTF